MKTILILSANPADTTRLRLDKEVREIKKTLKQSNQRDEFKVISVGAVQIDDLQQTLYDYRPTIVHFSGHGSGNEGLILEDSTGRSVLVSEDALARLFQAFQTEVECVLLNACYSQIQARAIHQNIDCVVGMNQAIGDEAAIKFAVGFYRALGAGESYRNCFESGRTLIDLNALSESDKPQIKFRPRRESLAIGSSQNSKKAIKSIEKNVHSSAYQPKPMLRSRWNDYRNILASSIVITGLVMGFRFLGILETWELKTLDALIRLKPDQPPDPRLLIVTVTESDIQAQNPNELRGSLSDPALKQLLEKLNQHQPRVIGLDIYRPFPVQQNQQDLANLLKQSKNFIGICELGGDEDNPSVPPPDEVPLQQVGFSDVPLDRDGIVRRLFFGMSSNPECNTEKSFSFQVAYHYLQDEGIEFKRISDKTFQIGSVEFKKLEAATGGYHRLDAMGYQILLNYRSSQAPAKTVTLGHILNDRFDPKWIEDKIVLIGTTAESIDDGFLTPYSAGYSPLKFTPGVFIQAQMISHILSVVENDRPLLRVLPEWGEFVFVLGYAFINGILFTLYFDQQKKIIIISCFVIGSVSLVGLSVIGYLALMKGIWLPIFSSGVTLILMNGFLVLSSVS
ncbi:CHASE2 domain-containing protein [Capilliphycus salinus ALCB114379]|uniref:CHASE2 domain-containing protein n=1 Tax=Capilliphycus salinus TaxID=2768948 RepID=UPI0039A59DB0